jgi:GTP-binding protein
MNFIDEVTIRVQAGAGGDGMVAWRREAHVPRGGPAGGDGGNGGDVILEADPGLWTLLDLRYGKEYRAKPGGRGQGHDCFGKSATPLVVRIPCGTAVHDAETGELLCDLVEPGARFVAARGGRGGHGNLHYVSSTNRAPQRADPGEPGEERRLRLELKLIADAGVVGLPNAGKSTLIARVSSARPKIADYPFTTLQPKLGLVSLSDERSFVIADLPGLIEGAHQGAGLGHRFLRHIERTRVLLFLLDDRHALEQTEGSPLTDLRLLRAELAAHDPTLVERPAICALNKTDILPPGRAEALVEEFSREGTRLLLLSAATGQGTGPVLEAVWRALGATSGRRSSASPEQT